MMIDDDGGGGGDDHDEDGGGGDDDCQFVRAQSSKYLWEIHGCDGFEFSTSHALRYW